MTRDVQLTCFMQVMVDPKRVFELGIHHVSRTLTDDQCSVYHVDPSDAIIHHYRHCVVDFDVHIDCTKQCVDDTLLQSRRIPILRQRVQKTMQLLASG
jgi:Glycosyltransferase family 92